MSFNGIINGSNRGRLSVRKVKTIERALNRALEARINSLHNKMVDVEYEW